MSTSRYQPYNTPEERRMARALRQLERLGITEISQLGWFQRADFKHEPGCGTVTLDALDRLLQSQNLPRIGEQLRTHRLLKPAPRRADQTWPELAIFRRSLAENGK